MPTPSTRISGVLLAQSFSTDENCLLTTPYYELADLFSAFYDHA